MHYSIPRLEHEAKRYQRGVMTNSELVWDAWTTAKEDSRGLTDRVAVLRAHLSAEAFATVQLAARNLWETWEPESTGFLPCCFAIPEEGAESRPEFVPRSFIERLAIEVQHV